MKRAFVTGLMALILLGMAGVGGYFFYARMTSPPYWGLPAVVITAIVVSLAYHLAFLDYASNDAPPLQMQLRPRAPQKAPPAMETLFTGLALLLVFFFGVLWRHASYASENTLGIDAWWPIVLPVATGMTAVAWLTDTLFLRIINGSHSGRSPAALRSALIVKRAAVAALAFAGAFWLGLSHMGHAHEAYRSTLAQAWLSGVPALAISLMVIRR